MEYIVAYHYTLRSASGAVIDSGTGESNISGREIILDSARWAACDTILDGHPEGCTVNVRPLSVTAVPPAPVPGDALAARLARSIIAAIVAAAVAFAAVVICAIVTKNI